MLVQLALFAWHMLRYQAVSHDAELLRHYHVLQRVIDEHVQRVDAYIAALLAPLGQEGVRFVGNIHDLLFTASQLRLETFVLAEQIHYGS